MPNFSRSRKSTNVVIKKDQAYQSDAIKTAKSIYDSLGEAGDTRGQRMVQERIDARTSPNHRVSLRDYIPGVSDVRVDPLHAGARVHNQGLTKK